MLHYAPSVAGEIINACAMLHNICLSEGVALDEIVTDSEMFDTAGVQGDGDDHRSAGARIRDRICRQLAAQRRE